MMINSNEHEMGSVHPNISVTVVVTMSICSFVTVSPLVGKYDLYVLLKEVFFIIPNVMQN